MSTLLASCHGFIRDTSADPYDLAWRNFISRLLNTSSHGDDDTSSLVVHSEYANDVFTAELNNNRNGHLPPVSARSGSSGMALFYPGESSSDSDETRFLCGTQRHRRYGTYGGCAVNYGGAASSSAGGFTPGARKFDFIIKHEVQPSDTLRSIALRYDSCATEIKRINRLWANEALYLKDVILIPVNKSSGDGPGTSTKFSEDELIPIAFAQSQLKKLSRKSESKMPRSNTSPLASLSDYQPSSEQSPLAAADLSVLSSGSQTAATAVGLNASDYDQTKSPPMQRADVSEKLSDLFSRIDMSIKATATQVKRLEEQSALDKLPSPTSDAVSPVSDRSKKSHRKAKATIAKENNDIFGSTAEATTSFINPRLSHSSGPNAGRFAVNAAYQGDDLIQMQ